MQSARTVHSCLPRHLTVVLKEPHPFHMECAEVIPSSEQPFSPDSVVFPDVNERRRAMDIVRRYANRLSPEGPFGFANVQGLVSFFFNTPDNTLPIFWSTANAWQPLFPFGTTSSTYTNAVQRGRGPVLPALVRSSESAIIEVDTLGNLEIDPEIAIEVLKEFQSLPALVKLAPILSDLKMPLDTLRALILAIQKLRHAVHEQQPVRTALLVVPGHAFREKGLQPFVAPIDRLHLREWERVQEL